MLAVCSEVNRCYDEAENFHATFVGQSEAKDAYLLALQTVRLMTILAFMQPSPQCFLLWKRQEVGDGFMQANCIYGFQ